jgi:hypothetical protein
VALVTRVAWLVPAVALVCSTTAGAQDFSLEIRDGLVTLVANDAPLRDVLSEWSRVGQTTIVDGDKLPGQSVTLRLIAVPEARALQTLLRSASGFLAAPRPSNSPGVSRYDRIVILATSRAPRNAPQPTASPVFPGASDPMADPAAVTGDPMYGLSPDQEQQFQQLQELLQQPSAADTAPVDQNVPVFSDRPGMPSAVSEPEPPNAGRPQRPPFARGNPFVPEGGVAAPGPSVPAPPPVYPQPFFPLPAPER